MKKFLGLIAIILCLSCCSRFEENVYKTQLNNAEENFKHGNFSKAVEIYESLIQIEKVKNPYVYYNLSNAYYKNGNLGKAILNSKKALKLMPRDKEIKNNDNHLDGVLCQPQKKGLPYIISQFFSLNEITTISAIFLILLFIELSLLVIKNRLTSKKIVKMLTAVSIICVSFFILKFYNEIMLKEAVVLSRASVKKDPDKSGLEISIIPEGKTVSVLSTIENMSNIRVESEEGFITGWVESNVIGYING
ncbi:MAG: tetratricopeptide repeat protein [Endomicrobium sp.]|jgi:tetratricopeptide (TPR) repeat protein|nr:tetratricopeptide repeat protein [Endomicrobium sp.]